MQRTIRPPASFRLSHEELPGREADRRGSTANSAKFPHIPEDKLAEFKRLAAEALAITKSEPGCLQYDWFLSADATECVVHEVYANSDAVLAHMAGVGALIGPLMQLGGGLEIVCFGDVSPALREAAAALKPNY